MHILPVPPEDSYGVCPMCEHVNVPYGSLGRLAHYRCAGCGAWFSREVVDVVLDGLTADLASGGAA